MKASHHVQNVALAIFRVLHCRFTSLVVGIILLRDTASVRLICIGLGLGTTGATPLPHAIQTAARFPRIEGAW